MDPGRTCTKSLPADRQWFDDIVPVRAYWRASPTVARRFLTMSKSDAVVAVPANAWKDADGAMYDAVIVLYHRCSTAR